MVVTHNSEDDGIILRRKTASKQSTIEAHGLQEGMPVGSHFNRRIYDDIMTEDMSNSPAEIEKAKLKFDSSQNLTVLQTEIAATEEVQRVVGTVYAFNDVMCYVRDKKDQFGKPLYHLRFKPATDDGTPKGLPVLMTQEQLDKLKSYSTFYAQQLLNPVPEGTQSLDPGMLREVEPEMIPRDLYKVLIVEPAGDKEKQKFSFDDWAIMLFGISPNTDDLGASNVYLLNAAIQQFTHAQAIESIVRIYIAGGVIMKVGVEKVGLTTIEIHVADALRVQGRHVSTDDNSLVILSPAGREKNFRIEQALDWPLKNGKLHISKSVPAAYRDRIKQEMQFFPKWGRDDALDAWAYLYDVMKDLKIYLKKDDKEAKKKDKERNEEYDPLHSGRER
jgi:hypothetical protein